MSFKYPEDTVGGAKERLFPRNTLWDKRYLTRIKDMNNLLIAANVICTPKTVTLIDLGNGFLARLPGFKNPNAKIHYVIAFLLIEAYGCK